MELLEESVAAGEHLATEIATVKSEMQRGNKKNFYGAPGLHECAGWAGPGLRVGSPPFLAGCD